MKRLNGKMLAMGSILMLAGACGQVDESSPSDGSTAEETGTESSTGKGDIPDGNAEELCPSRHEDIMLTGRPRFQEDLIRWPIADVEGVNTVFKDDRGQEYGEYFAVLDVPTEDGMDWESEPAVRGHGTTQLALELNDDQRFMLEDAGDDVVGSCVFTSWHSDVESPLPCESDESCPDVRGVELSRALFKMTNSINSNGAASDLLQRCAGTAASGEYLTGDSSNPDDPLHEDFMRGCFLTEQLFRTHWRSSDPQLCSAAMRLAECGCQVAGAPEKDLGFALVPPYDCPRLHRNEDGTCQVETQIDDMGGVILRGFPLGTWDDPNGLPDGCQYIDTGLEVSGEMSRTLVECDIRGTDLLANLADPKEFCRQKYGDDVVVQVPIPPQALACEPGKSQYADSCSAQPWVITTDAERERQREEAR